MAAAADWAEQPVAPRLARAEARCGMAPLVRLDGGGAARMDVVWMCADMRHLLPICAQMCPRKKAVLQRALQNRPTNPATACDIDCFSG